MKDYYSALDVERNASKDDIKKAFRNLAKQYHPDKAGKSGEEKFKEISEAYAVLSDDEKRKNYDSFGSQEQFRQKYDEQEIYRGFNPNDAFQDMSFEDIREVMDFFFRNPYIRQGSVGRVIHIVQIDLEHVLQGAVAKLKYKALEKVPIMPNAYTEREKSLDVIIPAGIKDRQMMRLKGEGSKTQSGTEDIYLEIRVKPHEKFSREGNDLYLEHIISKQETTKGETRIKNLENKTLTISIPQNAQGKRIRLKGQGLPDMKTKQRGNLYVYLREI